MGILSDVGGFITDPIGSSLNLVGLGPPGGGISGIFGGSGGGSDAGLQAAQLEAAGNRRAIKELRRQFGITQENIAPFLEAGVGALPQVQEGTTVEGLDARLARIFNTDIFGSLVDERTRAVEGRNAATGNFRSGAGLLDASRVPTEIGFALEQLLTGRSSNLAGSGQNAALGLGSFGADTSANIANLFRDTGEAQGAGILTDAQSNAAFQQNLLNTAATSAAIFFSDPNLKENVEVIGRIGNLPIVQWDWIEKAQNTIVGACHTIGFLSTDVNKIYPEFVSKFCGFEIIDYNGLLNKLETINAT